MPLQSGAVLARTSANSGWPGPESLELLRAGRRLGFWSFVTHFSFDRNERKMVLSQKLKSGGIQLEVVDLATGATQHLPQDECTSGHGSWTFEGRLVTYGSVDFPTANLCLLDDKFQVIARLRGDFDHAAGSDGPTMEARFGTLPRDPKVFYIHYMRSGEALFIDLVGTRRAWFEFPHGGTTWVDMRDFTFASPVVWAQREWEGKISWEAVTGRARQIVP